MAREYPESSYAEAGPALEVLSRHIRHAEGCPGREGFASCDCPSFHGVEALRTLELVAMKLVGFRRDLENERLVWNWP